MEVDLINKCRVCLRDDKEMHYLFAELDKGVTLRDILTTTGFEVEKDDGFSSYLCENCTTVIVDFYNLKTIYEDNEKQIKSLLDSTEMILVNKDVETSPVRSESEDYITIKVETDSDNEESDDYDFKQDSSDVAEQDPQKIDNTVEYEYQEINTYTCPECGDCFLYKPDIEAHMLSKHDITEIDYDEITELSLLKVKKCDPNSPTTKCKICNKDFDSEDEYKEHMETHKSNVCDICGLGFIKKSYLKDHQEIHCTEKRHVCTFCNKAFKRRTVLVKHRRIHTHPRQCICEVCGKAFNDKGTLKTHIMLKHIRERNYMCLICGVKFPLKATLEKHIRRHQNKEREFFCTQCPLGYRDKSSLDRHIYVKHSGQNVKSTCPDCGKQYTTLGNLFKHQRLCHNASPMKTEEAESTL